MLPAGMWSATAAEPGQGLIRPSWESYGPIARGGGPWDARGRFSNQVSPPIGQNNCGRSRTNAGFPRLRSIIHMPCSVSTFRSSNRTGGFPASGSRTRVMISPTSGDGEACECSVPRSANRWFWPISPRDRGSWESSSAALLPAPILELRPLCFTALLGFIVLRWFSTTAVRIVARLVGGAEWSQPRRTNGIAAIARCCRRSTEPPNHDSQSSTRRPGTRPNRCSEWSVSRTSIIRPRSCLGPDIRGPNGQFHRSQDRRQTCRTF